MKKRERSDFETFEEYKAYLDGITDGIEMAREILLRKGS